MQKKSINSKYLYLFKPLIMQNKQTVIEQDQVIVYKQLQFVNHKRI